MWSERGRGEGERDGPIHQFFLDVRVTRLTCMIGSDSRRGTCGSDDVIPMIFPRHAALARKYSTRR